MINALAVKDKDLIVARWFKKDEDPTNYGGTIIKVMFTTEVVQSTSQPVQNLRVKKSSTIVETHYNYDFEVYDKLVFNGGKWLISDVSREHKDTKAKSLAFARIQYAEKYTRLHLTRLDDIR